MFAAGPEPRAVSAHRLALSRPAYPPPSAPLHAPAATALPEQVNSEPRRPHQMDSLTKLGGDPPHLGCSAIVILTVIVVEVGYEEVR